MMLQIPFRRLATLAVTASLAVLLVPAVALGHAELETATPADGSTVTEPVVEVSGLYSEAMADQGSRLVVLDASGAEVARGGVDPEDDTRMVATPPTPLTDGEYTVESTARADDGHVERTTWTFTVAIAATPEPTPVPTAVPTATVAATASSVASPAASAVATAAPTAPASAAPTPVPSADGTPTGGGGDVILPIVVALIVLGAGAAYLLTRRNRPPDPT